MRSNAKACFGRVKSDKGRNFGSEMFRCEIDQSDLRARRIMLVPQAGTFQQVRQCSRSLQPSAGTTARSCVETRWRRAAAERHIPRAVDNRRFEANRPFRPLAECSRCARRGPLRRPAMSSGSAGLKYWPTEQRTARRRLEELRERDRYAGILTPIVSSPAVAMSGTAAVFLRTRVSGPGKKSSINRLADSGTSAASFPIVLEYCDVCDQRIVRRPLLRLKNLSDRRFIKDIRAQSIDGLGRKRDDTARFINCGGLDGILCEYRLHERSFTQRS